jgi:hypothetical protein
MKYNKTMKGFCIAIFCTLLSSSTIFAQVDSLPVAVKKQSLFLSAGLCMPISDYASTNGNKAAYANKGFATISNYNYGIYKMIEVVFSHIFIVNKLNDEVIASNLKSTIGAQVDNDITYTSAKSSNWNSNSVLGGLGLRTALDGKKKLKLYVNAQAGISLVNSPRSETLVQIDQLFYSTKVKKSMNWAPIFTGNIGINYLFAPKTGLVFNANYLNINLVGNNLDVTEIGNNTYQNKIYSFEQKINSLNFTLGISTHF